MSAKERLSASVDTDLLAVAQEEGALVEVFRDDAGDFSRASETDCSAESRDG